MRGRFDDVVIDGATIRRYLKLDSDVRTLGGAITVVDESPTILQYDAGGSSRNVTFPTRALVNDGQIRIVSNISTAGENLTIKDASANTLLTLPSSGCALVIAMGTSEAPGTRGWIAVQIGGEDMSLTDALTVAGILTASSTLVVAKQGSFTSNLVVASTIAGSSNMTLASTLALSSNATVASTLTASSNATVASTLTASSDVTVASTLTASSTFLANKNATLGSATSHVIGFYGGTGSSQRTSSNQTSSNAAVSASFGATQLAILQEIMNTLTAASLWKGS